MSDNLTLVSEKRLRELIEIEKEVKALREFEKAVRDGELRQPWFVLEAILKLDEARRGWAHITG